MRRMPRKAVCAIITLLLVVPAAGAVRPNRINRVIAQYAAIGQFNGVALVAKGGTVIARQHTGYANLEWMIPNAIDTKFRIGSVTKSFTAILALQLADRGTLDLDRAVAHYLPQFADQAIGRATVRHLLAHSSGLPDYNKVPEFFRAVQSGILTEKEILARIGAYELLFAPGTQFNYSNDGYRLLGAIIEQVTGKPYARVLADNVLEPTGMAASGYMSKTAVVPKLADGYRKRLAGVERAPYYEASPASGMYATADDLYRWYQALEKGKLVSAQAREVMWSVVPSGNAFGWLVKPATDGREPSNRLIVSEGAVFGFFAWTAHIPADDVTIILLTNMRGSTNHLPALGQAIIDVLAGRDPVPPRASVAETLLPIIVAEGVEAGVVRYQSMRRQPARFNLGEQELNSLGYELMNRDRLTDAIRIFELNAAEHPTSANVFDSLGEAHLRAGNRQQAIENYERSLALNPGNENAAEILKRLRTQSQ